MHEAPNNMIIKMLEDANKISETNYVFTVLFYERNDNRITLQTLKDTNESNS